MNYPMIMTDMQKNVNISTDMPLAQCTVLIAQN